MAMSRNVVLCCFCLASLGVSRGLNLDFEFPVIKQGPPGSLFGFAVEQHEFTPTNAAKTHRILVGAPKGSNKYQKSLNSPGTVYKCDPTSVSPSCEDEVPFDTFGNSIDGFEDKSNQWFGVSIKSGGSNKPVLACAHRYLFKTSGRNFHLYEGTCLTATASLGRGEILSPCNELNVNLARSATVPSYQNSGQCLAGIGADIFELGNQMEFLIGTVGYVYFQGAVFRMIQQTDEGSQGVSKSNVNGTDAGLIGYSVDHGTFFDKNKVDMASGGPRSSSNGMVVLFRKEKNVNASGYSLNFIQTLPADSDQVQIGSSFGFAVRAIDSDKDGLSELLVGAPFHADPSYPGHGMVYYYKNNGLGKLTLKEKFAVKGARSNFGSAIASVGDLDLDGFDDAVVGAPFENDGQGAIYVFRGSKDGLQGTPSQKIMASEVKSGLLGFGRSLAGGYDLDNNGYKDVLVGAFASDSAALLRSRPVIEIESIIQFRNDFIDPSSGDPSNPPQITFRLCLRYIEKSGKVNGAQSAFVQIEVDPGVQKRMLLSITDTSTAETVLEVTRTQKCTSYVGYFQYRKDGSYSVYPDISVVVKYRLQEDAKRKPTAVDGTLTSLDTYAVLSPSSSRMVTGFLRFKRDCGPCIPDLAIETKKNQTIRLGTSTYPMNVTIKNHGRDPAYGVAFSVTLPEGINFNDLRVESRRIQCEDAEKVEDKKSRTLCKTVFSEFSNTSMSVITLILDTKDLSPFGTKNEVTLNVSSANAEVGTYENNVVTVPLTIKATADLALSGSFKTRQEFYGGEIKGESVITYDDEIGHVVKHRYYVLNYGPDLLPSAVVTLHWPSEAVSGKHLLYLTSVETENAECFLKPGQVNPRNFKLRFANATSYISRQDLNRKRVRKEVDVNGEPKASAEAETESGAEPAKGATTVPSDNSEIKPSAIEEGSTSSGGLGEKGGMEGKVLDCRKKTARCTNITCEVKNFKKGGNAYITLTSRIWNSTFLMDYYGDVITVVSFAEVTVGSNVSYIKDEDLKNNNAELFTVIRPDFPAKIIERIAVWKIALAILAGLILLALLIFGFYKVGFFNRRRGSPIRKKTKVDGAEDSLLGSKKS